MWTTPVNKCTPPASLPKGKISLSCGNVSYQVPFRMKWRYDTVWTAKKFLYITSKNCKQAQSYDKSNGYFTLQHTERERADLILNQHKDIWITKIFWMIFHSYLQHEENTVSVSVILMKLFQMAGRYTNNNKELEQLIFLLVWEETILSVSQ